MSIDLNENQKKAVTYYGNKPLLIEAGPGSGKTRVIIERVKYLINERNIDPKSLLVSTFSIKAAEELKERLAEDLDKEIINEMQISTIHSFCIKLLRENGHETIDIYDDEFGEKKNMFVLKNLNKLGFTREKTVTKGQIAAVIKKFDEYSIFNVDTDKLVEYIEENHPVSEEYLEFIDREYENGKFPRKKIDIDKKKKEKGNDYGHSWYNARYLQVAKAYPKYIELLNKEGATDFNFIQIDAYNLLKDNPKTQYTNILVDEFQDTDPIQIKIFEVLMNEALANGGTFTAVGDIDQNIYGFRGAITDYFEYLNKHYDTEVIPLNINYRSTDEIISLTEQLIRHQRSDSSKKHLQGNRKTHIDSYYIENETKEDEADKIVSIIKHMKESGKIKDYSDIAILYRSVRNSSGPLIERLKEEGISYQVSGIDDLIEKDEIKSIMLLLHFLTERETKVPIFTSYEKEWLNLKGFTGFNFNTELWNLSEDTKEILNKIQDEYEENLIAIQKEIVKEERAKGVKISAKRSFSGVFDHEDEILEKIFERIKKPILTNENLKAYGVRNEDDLKFFESLNNLKEDVININKNAKDNKVIRNARQKLRFRNKLKEDEIETLEEIANKTEKPETILEIYYKLLEITDFLNEDFVNNEENIEKIENIAILTRTMYNYENMISKRDFIGLYWYLHRNIRNYGSSVENINGVQLMTIHKSKGLEFPITIISSLTKPVGRSRGFPNKYVDPSSEENRHINGQATYYTPNYCLKDRNLTEKDEEIAHYKEEERIIYVAMTRAQDILILSSIGENGKKPEIIQNLINNNPNLIRQLDYNNINTISSCEMHLEKEETNTIRLSYTSLDNYHECPFRYNLNYNMNFRVSDNEYITYGNISHNALEEINKINMEEKEKNKQITKEMISKTVTKMYFNTPNIKHDEEDLNEVLEQIHSYWDKFGNLKVLESEYPFEIKKDNYTLTGFIDLIYETKDGIAILDYKTTDNVTDYKKEKYARQLYTYTLALKEDPKYRNKDVTELKIYAIKSKEMIDIPLNPEKVNQRNQDIKEIVDGIINKKFPKKENKECSYCKFNFICYNN